jgi:hypothetical protein
MSEIWTGSREGEIRYYAVSGDAPRIRQMLVIREKTASGSRPKSNDYTGVVYRTMRAAVADLERLNCPRHG